MHTPVAAPPEPWSRRPRFAPRQLLDAERLNAALDDELERQRLLNVALHGWGVVFGFGVSVPEAGREGRRSRPHRLLVTCGLALDAYGRMLRTDDRWLSLADVEGPRPDRGGTYTLLAHHAERLDPSAHDVCSGTGPQWREYGIVFTLRPGCEPVHDRCPELEDPCLSRTDYVRRRIGAAEGSPGRAPDLDHACDRPGGLRPTRCGEWCYDPAAGVPIACLEICDRTPAGDADAGECGSSGYEGPKGRDVEQGGDRDDRTHRRRTGDEPCIEIDRVCTDECSPVHHVYRNPLLSELISCCDVDLPRIDHVSWPEWTMSAGAVPWEEFARRIQAVDETRAADGFAVWFTRPVRTDTLTTASVILTALVQETRADYWIPMRVPITVRPLEVADGLALGVQIVPTADWIRAEITGERSSLYHGSRMEVSVRGQLLRDDCGHLLDATPVDVGCAPCQGRPGDDIIWAFAVGRRRDRPDDRGERDPYDATRQGATP